MRCVFSILMLSLVALTGAAENAIDVMCVYYPHWHRYPKGDEWFGADNWKEAEWTFVKTPATRFLGQINFQPFAGYLDGANPRDVATEIDLASNAGITVFLYDYYWYNGEKTQEEAIEEGFLKAKNRGKMKFALMWCYHERKDQFRPPYTKDRRNLMTLAHTPEEFLGLIDYSILHYFNCPEYYRKDGKLFFSIYNFPYLWKKWGEDDAKVREALFEARRRVKAAGLGELHLNAQGVSPDMLNRMAALGIDSFTDYGYSTYQIKDCYPRFNDGEVCFDFREIDGPLQSHWKKMRDASPVPYIPIVPTGWDSTLRCRLDVKFPWTEGIQYPYTATFTNNTDVVFEKYLRDAKAAALADPKNPGIVYINAWNEYTEGCWLLPDIRRGDLRLRAVARVFGRKPNGKYAYTPMFEHWKGDKAVTQESEFVDVPDIENFKYGFHERQGIDVWMPKCGNGRVPAVVVIHGGGWTSGDRIPAAAPWVKTCRERGIALLTVGYRFIQDAKDMGVNPPVSAPLEDAIAAMRCIKDNAAKWNIDVSRIGVIGGSAGACTALYLSLRNENDFGIRAVAPAIAQTSLDPQEMREWIPNIAYGAYAFGYDNFNEWLLRRTECMAYIELFSPAALARKISPEKAPRVFLHYSSPPEPGQSAKDATHSAVFGVKFKELCDSRGIQCEIGYGGKTIYGDSFDKLADFLLGGDGTKGPNRAELIEEGAEWRPVEMGNHECVPKQPVRIPELEIVRGTALDLSQVRPWHNIDANGRVISDSEGRLVFENAPDRPVRMRGFNCTYGGNWDGFHTASKDEIVALANQIRLMGFDLVRLHFFDAKFVGLSGLKWYKFRDCLADDAMPQTKEEIDAIVDKDFLDRFHWFVKCLRDQGVYLLFDVITPPNMMMTRAKKAEIKPRVNLFFSDKYRRHWKAAFDFWTQTMNPYTGTRFLDDPQVIGLTFCNEQDFVTFDKSDLSFFTSAFRAEYGADMPEFKADLLWSEGVASDNARAFIRARVREMTDFYIGVATKRGFRGLLTQWDMLKTPLGTDARRSLSAVAMHAYHAHPKFKIPLPEGVKNERRREPWNKGTCTEVPRGTSLTDDGRNYFERTAMARVLGKPFFVTEFSHVPGNDCVQEAPVVQSAVAALQDWQALLPHANTVRLWHYDPFPFFDEGMNLMARVASVATAFGWQRGDISRAPHAVSFTIPESMLNSVDLVPSLNRAYSDMAFVTRIGSDVADKCGSVATLNLVPVHPKDKAKDITQANDILNESVPQLQMGKEELLGEAMVARLRRSGILPPGNSTNPSIGFFESETGEVKTDLRKASMTVDAPRFQAAALKPGQTARLSQLSVESVSVPASVLAISLDPDRSVSGASRVLLIVATQFLQEGATVMRNGKRNLFIDEGPSYRQLMRAGRFRFSVAVNAQEVPKVYALRMNGTRAFDVPAKLHDGGLLFDMDMSGFEHATPFFEIVAKGK